MTEEMRSRLLGMMMARVSRGVFPQREPIGYLYGHVAKEGETPTHTINGVDYVGVVAPKLPDWDVTEFPYAFAEETFSNGKIWLYADSVPMDKREDIFVFSGTMRYLEFELVENAWVTDGKVRELEQGSEASNITKSKIHWSNYDITSEDGTIYMAAIAPIPVYDRIGGDS